jgi:aldose 1-epimerase
MALALTAVAQGEVKMSIWGHTKDGVAVPIYTLKSAQIEVRVMAYGAKLVSIRTPDRSGKMADVVLGYDSLDEYLNDTSTHFGSVVGRYGNRIAGGKFSIDGKSFQIPINNGKNALHGGPMGFDRYVWDAKEVPNGVEFTLVSPDGDMGFPGKMTAKVKYTLAGGTLRLDYSATSDKPTVVNLTNHAYFNLRGDDVGTILDEKLELNADKFTPVNGDLIPLGNLAPVAGTPLDFRKPEVVGARINSDHEQIKLGGGYDHNFVVNGNAGPLRVAAVMTDPESGRRMTVETTEPGVQFYTGNFLDGTFTGRHGVKYEKHTGFCLETQHFPDSPNQPSFPSTVLRPGVTRHSTTTFTFSTVKGE